MMTVSVSEIWGAGHETGIREVVDWLMSQVDFEDDEVCPYYVLNKNVCEAKLKEWGIEL